MCNSQEEDGTKSRGWVSVSFFSPWDHNVVVIVTMTTNSSVSVRSKNKNINLISQKMKTVLYFEGLVVYIIVCNHLGLKHGSSSPDH